MKKLFGVIGLTAIFTATAFANETPEAIKCHGLLNKSMAKTAAVQMKEVSRCVKLYHDAAIINPPVYECAFIDSTAVAEARDKIQAKIDVACIGAGAPQLGS